MENATAIAAAQAKAAKAHTNYIIQRDNENTPKFFAIGMISMMILFV
jgi:hypothetical protein